MISLPIISLTTKIKISKKVMRISWRGDVTPRTTPKEIKTAAVAKSAEINVTTSTSINGQLSVQLLEKYSI